MKTKRSESELAVEQAQLWANESEEIAELIGGRFPRSELRERAMTYLRVLETTSVDVGFDCSFSSRIS
jgi:hypothetical protein